MMGSTITPKAGNRLEAGEEAGRVPDSSKNNVGSWDNHRGLREAGATPEARDKLRVREAGVIPEARGQHT